MKSAFSMIELIFVIVILGILAAIAVPKIAATRNDAETTSAIASFKSAITQIQSNSTAAGAVPADLTLIVEGSANLLVESQRVTARDRASGGTNCATATVSGTNLVIAILATTGGCSIFASISESTIPLLGITVTR